MCIRDRLNQIAAPEIINGSAFFSHAERDIFLRKKRPAINRNTVPTAPRDVYKRQAVPFAVVFFVFSHAMIDLFMDNGSALAMQKGMSFLRIVSPFYLIVAVKLMADGVLRGAGAMSWFMTTTFTDLVLRVVLAFVFADALSMGAVGIWLSWPVGWSVASIISFLFYRKGVWRKKDYIEDI